MTTRYHINHDGKIYPCRAKVMRCPYSESHHSEDKVELYYKLMLKDKGEVQPSIEGLKEIRKYDRLESLESLSDDIAKSNAPIELIIHTLGEGLEHMSRTNLDYQKYLKHEILEKHAEDVYDLLSVGSRIPSNVPEEIVERAYLRLDMEDNGKFRNFGNSLAAQNKRSEVERTDYTDYYENALKLSEENYEETHEWMSRDFERFTRDLNASKMMTQPIFYGDLDRAKEVIRKMGNRELLSTFDDYSLSKMEIEENIREANFFLYVDRDDLSKEANDALRTWYDRNRAIYKSWKINSSKRILLSMEIADEIDRRDLARPDKHVGTLLGDYESEW